MRQSQPKQYHADTHRAVTRSAHADTIEWEELPSLAASRTPTWDNTLPAALDPVAPSQPFVERLEGLATREVSEPDVFRHFFGADPQG